MLQNPFSSRALAPGHCLDLWQIGPPDTEGFAIVQFDRPHAKTVVAQARYAIFAKDGGSMDTNELCRIEPFFQARDGLQQEIGPGSVVTTDMQADVVALGIDPIDFRRRDANEFGTMGNPQLIQPGAFRPASFTAPSCRRLLYTTDPSYQ